ncbi:MAG: phosphoribosyltransferase family protein [Bacteroidia bacterium]|nr:phosphoribosyltransferase family protein [Bacteroidia bacterium]
MLRFVRQLPLALADWFFPRLCAGCERPLTLDERQLCPTCLADLARTGYANQPTANELYRRVAALAPVTQAAAGFHFEAESRLQHIVHTLKYSYRPALGVYLGALLAHELGPGLAQGAQALVPVPLYPRRLAQRGYNQAERLASGMAQVWRLPVLPHAARRLRPTGTQTGLSRSARFENMEGAFAAALPPGLHTLVVVDDVATTGATLLAVLLALERAGATDLRVVTLGVAT